VIYFTQDTLTKAIKIGYSKNPKKRRSGLQSATPNPLVLLGSIHGGLDNERAYHDKFAQFRIQGEWFKEDILPAVLDIIAKNPIDRPPPSNIFISGDSHFRDTALVLQALDELHASNPIVWVITGGDRPFDCAAGAWARRHGVDVYCYYPNWRKHGRGAGAEVGRRMLRSMFDPKLFLIFRAETISPTTSSLIGRARKAGIEVVLRGGLQAKQETPTGLVMAQGVRSSTPAPTAVDDVPWTRLRAAAAGTEDDDDLPPWARKRGQ
jgi:hypothetical protein